MAFPDVLGTQEGGTLSETAGIAAVTVVCQEGQQGRREGTIAGMSAHVSQAWVPAVGMWEVKQRKTQGQLTCMCVYALGKDHLSCQCRIRMKFLSDIIKQ